MGEEEQRDIDTLLPRSSTFVAPPPSAPPRPATPRHAPPRPANARPKQEDRAERVLAYVRQGCMAATMSPAYVWRAAVRA